MSSNENSTFGNSLCTESYQQCQYMAMNLHSQSILRTSLLQITEAIRRYGVSDSTKSLLVVHVTSKSHSSKAIEENIKKVVDGTIVQFSELDVITDWDRVKKVRSQLYVPPDCILKYLDSITN